MDRVAKVTHRARSRFDLRPKTADWKPRYVDIRVDCDDGMDVHSQHPNGYK